MVDLGYLLRRLEPYLLAAPPGAAGVPCPERIELLEAQSALRADRLYLAGAGAALPEAVSAEAGALVLAAEGAQLSLPPEAVSVRLSCSLPCLFNTVSEVIADAAARRAVELEHAGGVFQRCWEAIIDRRITGSAEIREMLSRTPYPIGAFAHIAVVTFAYDAPDPPYLELISHLRAFFPQSNMTIWQREIVLLLTYNERCFRFEFPEKELSELLSEYDVFLTIGNGTRNLSALPFLHNLALQASLLARQLNEEKGKRCFFYEEYSIYCAIDLCAQRFKELHRSDDIIYLVHPAVVHLTRYDRKHNGNLRDVLYYYLRNDRNLIKTAADTYMHRNTVINKINKILELVDIDLEDGGLRQRLMFSCQIIRYYEKVMKLELRL